MTMKKVEWVQKRLEIPETFTNFALAANGATAKASASDSGFCPEGAINGERTLKNWGKGNGWQAPTPNWHPNWWGEWIEVAFPEQRSIDTIIVHTFPAFIHDRLWRGLRDFQIQCLSKDSQWITVKTIMGNQADYRVIRFECKETLAIRIWVTRNHYPEEKNFENGFVHINEAPRIVEIEAYCLKGYEIEKEELRCKEIEAGIRGSAAIFSDETFAEAVLPPEELAMDFRRAGYGVTLLDSEEISAAELLNPQNFSLLIHVYGKYAPLGANLYEFLQGGGHLLALGGRAFTAVKQKSGEIWIDLGMDPEITASAGRYNDSVRPYREQLGIFTIPHSQLKYVQEIRSSPCQSVVTEKISLPGPFNGWMACGCVGEILPLDESARYAEEKRMDGFNHQSREGIASNRSEEPLMWGMNENMPPVFSHPCARWIPLLNAYDEYGRDRGAAAAVLAHFEGMYRGSHWAFFGVENKAFYEQQQVREALPDIVEYLHLGICLHHLEPEFACYRQGEKAGFSVILDNCGREVRDIEIRLEIYPAEGEQTLCYSASHTVRLQPGSWEQMEEVWKPEKFELDLYKIKASVYMDGKLLDTMENGFTVWNEETLKQAPRVEFKDNYFHFDGNPRYVVGARDSGLHLPGAPDENPLGWDEQYRMMRDFGMQVTSPVHIDWLIPGIGWGGEDRDNPVPEVILRRMDAQAILAQKYSLIYAPGLFFSYEEQAIKNPELSKRICEAIGRRYVNVPGIMFYLVDDCLKHTPEVFNRWTKICVDALNSAGRKYMVTAEFGFRQEWPDTFRQGCKNLTFNAGSCFQRTVGDPVYERLVDMRPAGKSFTLGEFVRRIPAGTSEDFHGYLAPPHLNFGMGYAMALNWKWRTGYHAIWPSDVVFPGNWIPKDHLYAFRNEALFFRRFRPVYRSPRLLVVLPSAGWLKNTDAVTRYLVSFLRRLMEQKVDFACLDDTDLHNLPGDTKAIIYPIPMEMTDEIYSQVKSFVGAGGKLLATGDISAMGFGMSPGLTRRERLTELCGLRHKGFAYASFAKGHSLFSERFLPEIQACDHLSVIKTGTYTARPWIETECERAEAIISDKEGRPVVTAASYGNGRVWFTPDMSPELPAELLSAFLAEAGVERNRILPDSSTLYCFKTETFTGSIHTIVTFPWDQGRQEVEVATAAGAIRLVIKEQSLGMIHAGEDGTVNAVETQGDVTVNGAGLVETDSHIMAVSLDDRDLRESERIAIYPIRPGKVLIYSDILDSAEAGEFVDGHWHSHELLEHTKTSNSFAFEITPIRATAWILAYGKDGRSKCIAAVESMLN